MRKRIFRSIFFVTLAALMVLLVIAGAALYGRIFQAGQANPDVQPQLTAAMAGMWQYWILALLAALAVSLCLAARISRQIIQPLKELDPDDPMSGKSYEELTPLLRRIDSQRRQLLGQTTELKRKQREFDTVIKNMNEGLVLLNSQCTVLTMNTAAARIMGLVRPFVSIDFLTLNHREIFEPLLNTALSGQHAEEQATLSGNIYQLNASPVRSGGGVSGVVLLMFDITHRHRLEAQRREFTANVSHELKTPLQSISGHAELLKTGLVPPEDVPVFSENIYSQSHRMIRLIEDILRLSRLDEGREDAAKEWVDLYQLTEHTLAELADTARKNQVALHLSGSSCRMESHPHLLEGIVTNLCTNAIKYNRPGGSVQVTVSREGADICLTVSDTGIGIAPEHQQRIFERFYRVDKSRSKAVGGTGLGLSIVKHAAMILGARIDLHSTPGQGTTVTVRFPENPSDPT